MKLLVVSFIFSLFLSCEKDPYPSQGDVRKDPRDEQREVPDTIAIAVEKKYEFDEGKNRTVNVGVFVPAPGVPDLTIKNAPEGLVFDKENFTFSWMPGPFQGNDINDPTKKTRVYTIELLLRNALDLGGETRTAAVTLVVNDVPRNFSIEGRDKAYVTEGKTLEYEFEMENIDYPKGGFDVTIDGGPSNLKPIQIDDTRYKLVYKPDYFHVKLNERKTANYDIEIKAYNPAKHVAVKTVELEVVDSRLGVTVVAPPTMEQGLDSTFQVSAYDENAEVAPQISLVGDKPNYGEFKLTPVKDEVNNSSVLNVVWKDIPPSYNGQNKTFRFKACVLNQYRGMNNCKTVETTLKIRVKDRKAPVFNRWPWDVGEVKYFKNDEYNTFRISAEDGDNGQNITELVVQPESMRKYVTWSNGRLSVRCDKPGIHQFSLVAKSEYNMSSAESFVFEVFKKDRSKTIYFTDSTRDKEVKFFKENMDNIEIMNPAIQILDDRALAGRETLVLGTSALLDDHFRQEILTVMDNVKNIIIASPMVENLPKEFLNLIEDDLKVTILGRYSQLPTSTKLQDLYFVQRPDFTKNSDAVTLAGNASSKSFDPVVFHDGVLADKCDDVLELNDSTGEQKKSYSIGIICNLPGKGRLALLGTEFADIKGTGGDEDIAKGWFSDMLNKKVVR